MDQEEIIDKKDVTAEIGDKVLEENQELREVVHGGMRLHLQGLGEGQREREQKAVILATGWLFTRTCFR